MDEQQLVNECANLLKDDPNKQELGRINYIDGILENRQSETTFIRKKGNILDASGVSKRSPENEKVFAIGDFRRRNYKKDFRLKTIELMLNVNRTNQNN